jgi:hypothetical protein
MKKGVPSTNGSDLNKDNIIKSTLDHLSEEDSKTLEAYHKEVDGIFLLHYKVTQQGLIQKDTMSIDIRKSEVTPEVLSNPSLSLDDVHVMINYALERQAKSSNELMHMLIEEQNRKKLVDSNVHASSSSCAVNFAQSNPQPCGTSAGGTSQLNPPALSTNHVYSRTTINGLAPACGMPQQTTTIMFGKGYVHATPSFSMPNPDLAPYTPGCNDRIYANTNGYYQASYTTVAYTDLIPLPDGSIGLWPKYTNNNTMQYNTYDPLEHGDCGYETPSQFLFIPHQLR